MSAQLVKVLGAKTFDKIQNSKVLLVGAGGIGCELLKNLILTGYGEIHLVDLDTIDLSNLNRQFLFRLKDIKKFKSSTAVEAVQHFNFENSKLVAHKGNIMDAEQFPISWFEQFDFILNALDNLQARSYINKISQFLNKPLMESGTSGFDGYIQPMLPNQIECFGCTAKETPKTFPVCTIRSTPSQPIHCIVWAKNFLFQQLFNKESINDDESVTNANDEDLGTTDKNEIERIKKETNELKELTISLEKSDIKEAPAVIRHIFTKIFKDDIEKLLLIETLWQTRDKPTPLSSDLINLEVGRVLTPTLSSASGYMVNEGVGSINDVWELGKNMRAFALATFKLMKRFQSPDVTVLEFDKDDEDTLKFVACAANIRSYIFGIPHKSVFDIKQIAGNIIPAIATTNAIIAGLSTLSSLNFLKLSSGNAISEDERKEQIKNMTMAFTAKASKVSQNKYLTNPYVSQPNPSCAVCSKVVRGIARVSKTATIKSLISILLKQYGFKEDLSILDMSKGRLLYDLDFEDLQNFSLHELLTSGESKDANILYITDEEGDGKNKFLKPVELYLDFKDKEELGSANDIVLPSLVIPMVEKPSDENPTTDAQGTEDDLKESTDLQLGDNGEIILDDDTHDETALSSSKKRDLNDKSAFDSKTQKKPKLK